MAENEITASSEGTQTGEPAIGQAELIALLEARIAQLEARTVQQPAPKAEKLPISKASKFDGSRDDQKVNLWLSEIDTMLKAHERQTGKEVKDEDKLIVAESHLDYTARRQYNIKVSRAGQFATYEAFKKWIKEYYAPPDVILSYRDKYETIKQDPNESIHHFHLRFTEIVDKLDEEPSQSWQASHFLNRLHHDTTRHLGSLCDIRDFKDITLDDIYQRIVRTIRLSGRNVSDGGNRNGGNWVGKGKQADGTSSRKDHKTSGHGVSGKSKPSLSAQGIRPRSSLRSRSNVLRG